MLVAGVGGAVQAQTTVERWVAIESVADTTRTDIEIDAVCVQTVRDRHGVHTETSPVT